MCAALVAVNAIARQGCSRKDVCRMNLIPTRVHGMMDYLMGVLLVAAPWLFRFNNGGPEQWVPVILGIGVIAYSLITRYELGAIKVMPMSAHLAMDVIG